MKLAKIIKVCLNPKVLLVIGGVILFAYIFFPEIANYAWVLLVLACPLSMMFMMANMDHHSDKMEKVFVCPECNMTYKDAEWAKKCDLWCKEHQSCNLEIIKHEVN